MELECSHFHFHAAIIKLKSIRDAVERLSEEPCHRPPRWTSKVFIIGCVHRAALCPMQSTESPLLPKLWDGRHRGGGDRHLSGHREQRPPSGEAS